MSLDLELTRLAIHYVDRKSNRLECAPQEQIVETLSPTIIRFFVNSVSQVWSAEEKSANRSGHFVPDDDPSLGPSVVKQHLQNLRQADGRFFNASKELATHLYRQMPGTASAGIIAILQLIRPVDGKTFIAILKVRHKDENFVRVLSQALTQLEVEQVENMLLDDIQKGALIPHPEKDDYDLKLIDKVTTGEPAKYFAEGFLGCSTKKSDEHQVKKLLPELQQYARRRGLPLQREKLPGVIVTLKELETDITTSVVSEVVHEQEIFGADFQPDDFETFINQESDVGPIDIPRERFNGRGKTLIPRSITYKFRDPRYRGVTINGPTEILRDILSMEGDTAIFRIETTANGFDVAYE